MFENILVQSLQSTETFDVLMKKKQLKFRISVHYPDTRVSNGTGQKFLHCPGTKGQRDKLKILQRDSLSNSGTGHGMGWYKILTACPVLWDKTGQSRKGHSKTEKGCSKTAKGRSKT